VSALGRMARLFQSLDTRQADAALERLETSTKGVHVRARALRMDICCGDPGEIAEQIRILSGNAVHRGGRVLREIFGAPTREPLPADLQDLVNRLP
jgi:hypothetical protein